MMRWPRSIRASAVARSTFASLAAAPFLPPTVGDLSDKRVGDSKESSTRFRKNFQAISSAFLQLPIFQCPFPRAQTKLIGIDGPIVWDVLFGHARSGGTLSIQVGLRKRKAYDGIRRCLERSRAAVPSTRCRRLRPLRSGLRSLLILFSSHLNFRSESHTKQSLLTVTM